MDKEPDKDYTAAVMQTMYHFSKERIMTDFRVKAGGRTVHCHLVVLSAKSTYFRSLSQSGLKEAILDSSVITDEHGHTLDLVIQFLYLGVCTITTQNVPSVLLAADFIQLKELKEKCEHFLSSHLKMEQLASFYQLAKKFQLQALCDECMLLAKKNFTEVARADFLLALSVNELCSLLMDEQLTVADEDDVIIALDRWLKNNRDGQPACKEYVEAIFPAIRIQFCSQTTLAAMSKDRTTPDPLRLRIFEYLNDGLHEEGPARSSYSPECRARQCARVSATPPTSTPAASPYTPAASSATPVVSSATPASSSTTPASSSATPVVSSDSPATSSASPSASSPTPATPAPNPAPKSSSPSSGAVPKTPEPSAAARPADIYEEILILGGVLPGFANHPNIVFLENDAGVADLPAPPMLATIRTQTPSVCINDEFLIVSGGLDLTTKRSVATVQIFDIRRKRWSSLPDLPHLVDLHGSTIANGNMYNIGGCYSENGETQHRYDSIHRIELPAGKWTECDARLPSAVSSPGIATVEDDIVIIGGRMDSTTFTAQTSRFNTKNGKLTLCQPMPHLGIVYHSTVRYGHHIYVLANKQFLCFDLQNDSWSSLAMPMNPSFHPAMVLKQHRLIAMGGYHVKGEWNNPNDWVQVYDLKTRKWEAQKNMPLKLTYHWAFVMKLSS